MHLKENTLFDLDPLVTGNVTQYPLQHVTYTPLTFRVDAFTGKYIFDL